MKTKVPIPAPTFCLQIKNGYSINGEKYSRLFSQENLKKIQNAWIKYESNTIEREHDIEKLNNHHPRAHFIVIYISSSFFALWK